MSNPYFVATGAPGTRSPGDSQPIRALFAAITAAFDKLPPTLTAGRVIRVNDAGTGLTASTLAINDSGVLTGVVSLTTTGNTILGDAQTDTLNVGAGDIRKNSSGNTGFGVDPVAKVTVQAPTGYGLRTGIWLNNPAAYGSGVGTASVDISFSRDPDNGTTKRMASIAGGNSEENSSLRGALSLAVRNSTDDPVDGFRVRSLSGSGISSAMLAAASGSSSPTEIAVASTSGLAITGALSVSGAATIGTSLRANGAVYGNLGVRGGAYGGAGANTAADDLVIEHSGSGGMTILTPSSGAGFIMFGDEGSNTVGGWRYDHTTNLLEGRAGGDTDAIQIGASGVTVTQTLTFNGGFTTDTTTAASNVDTSFLLNNRVMSNSTDAANIPVAGGLGVMLQLSRLSTAGLQIWGMASSSGANQRLFFRGGAASTWSSWSEIASWGKSGSFDALTATSITTSTAAAFMTTNIALTNGAGVATGTLTNAPSAGNPTKWIQINDNGTLRKIPTWT